MSVQREWFEKDYYAVLGVSKEVTQKEITAAYRQLAQAAPGRQPQQQGGRGALQGGVFRL